MKKGKLILEYTRWLIILLWLVSGCQFDESANEKDNHIMPVETVGRKNIDPNDVPPLVSKSLSLLFSDYTLIGWQECHSFYLNEDENEIHLYRDEAPSYYRAKIFKDGNKIAAFFKNNGEFIRWEKYISTDQLPEKIKLSIEKSKYKNWRFDDDLIEIYKERNYYYRLHFDSGRLYYFIEMNKNGEILHQLQRLNYALSRDFKKHN